MIPVIIVKILIGIICVAFVFYIINELKDVVIDTWQTFVISRKPLPPPSNDPKPETPVNPNDPRLWPPS